VPLGHVVDQFLDDNGFAYTSTTEQPDFSTLHEWSYEVNYLDARLKDFGLGLQIHEVRTVAVDGHERNLRKHGVSRETVQSTVRIAATIHAAARVLEQRQ
jgi:hypothetical protein